ncbi:MAG: hypothetical protein D6725_11755 [Planctomycetota bacterium]|nr:MAG: hypothetical protein D6725_11755 [Planctomycetota bacterium]
MIRRNVPIHLSHPADSIAATDPNRIARPIQTHRQDARCGRAWYETSCGDGSAAVETDPPATTRNAAEREGTAGSAPAETPRGGVPREAAADAKVECTRDGVSR